MTKMSKEEIARELPVALEQAKELAKNAHGACLSIALPDDQYAGFFMCDIKNLVGFALVALGELQEQAKEHDNLPEGLEEAINAAYAILFTASKAKQSSYEEFSSIEEQQAYLTPKKH